jgi:2-oxoglutarate ferredoxin oxidoreductase subunit beta
VNALDFMVPREEITTQYDPGMTVEVTQHDGSIIRLRKVAKDYDVYDRIKAMTYLQERQAAGEVVTGLLYLDSDPHDLHDYISTVAKPLNALGDEELCPGAGPLEKYNAANR